MRVRQLIRDAKTITNDTNWRMEPLPPRFSGIYVKTRPAKPGWIWRSTAAIGKSGDYILLCEINPLKDNWRAWLILRANEEGSIVVRYEYHGSHPGMHIHADCKRGGIELGPTSINVFQRIPVTGSERYRPAPARPDLFWDAARKYFRMDHAKGDLL